MFLYLEVCKVIRSHDLRFDSWYVSEGGFNFRRYEWCFLDNGYTCYGRSSGVTGPRFRLIAIVASWYRPSDNMHIPFVDMHVLTSIVAALQLKRNAISAGKIGADIYRPTIGFAGSMILASGLILIVSPFVHYRTDW